MFPVFSEYYTVTSTTSELKDEVALYAFLIFPFFLWVRLVSPRAAGHIPSPKGFQLSSFACTSLEQCEPFPSRADLSFDSSLRAKYIGSPIPVDRVPFFLTRGSEFSKIPSLLITVRGLR